MDSVQVIRTTTESDDENAENQSFDILSMNTVAIPHTPTMRNSHRPTPKKFIKSPLLDSVDIENVPIAEHDQQQLQQQDKGSNKSVGLRNSDSMRNSITEILPEGEKVAVKLETISSAPAVKLEPSPLKVEVVAKTAKPQSNGWRGGLKQTSIRFAATPQHPVTPAVVPYIDTDMDSNSPSVDHDQGVIMAATPAPQKDARRQMAGRTPKRAVPNLHESPTDSEEDSDSANDNDSSSSCDSENSGGRAEDFSMHSAPAVSSAHSSPFAFVNSGSGGDVDSASPGVSIVYPDCDSNASASVSRAASPLTLPGESTATPSTASTTGTGIAIEEAASNKPSSYSLSLASSVEQDGIIMADPLPTGFSLSLGLLESPVAARQPEPVPVTLPAAASVEVKADAPPMPAVEFAAEEIVESSPVESETTTTTAAAIGGAVTVTGAEGSSSGVTNKIENKSETNAVTAPDSASADSVLTSTGSSTFGVDILDSVFAPSAKSSRKTIGKPDSGSSSTSSSFAEGATAAATTQLQLPPTSLSAVVNELICSKSLSDQILRANSNAAAAAATAAAVGSLEVTTSKVSVGGATFPVTLNGTGTNTTGNGISRALHKNRRPLSSSGGIFTGISASQPQLRPISSDETTAAATATAAVGDGVGALTTNANINKKAESAPTDVSDAATALNKPSLAECAFASHRDLLAFKYAYLQQQQQHEHSGASASAAHPYHPMVKGENSAPAPITAPAPVPISPERSAHTADHIDLTSTIAKDRDAHARRPDPITGHTPLRACPSARLVSLHSRGRAHPPVMAVGTTARVNGHATASESSNSDRSSSLSSTSSVEESHFEYDLTTANRFEIDDDDVAQRSVALSAYQSEYGMASAVREESSVGGSGENSCAYANRSADFTDTTVDADETLLSEEEEEEEKQSLGLEVALGACGLGVASHASTKYEDVDEDADADRTNNTTITMNGEEEMLQNDDAPMLIVGPRAHHHDSVDNDGAFSTNDLDMEPSAMKELLLVSNRLGEATTVKLTFGNDSTHKTDLVIRSKAVLMRFDPYHHQGSSGNNFNGSSEITGTDFQVSPYQLTIPRGQVGTMYVTFIPQQTYGVYSGALKLSSSRKSFVFLLRGECKQEQQQQQQLLLPVPTASMPAVTASCALARSTTKATVSDALSYISEEEEEEEHYVSNDPSNSSDCCRVGDGDCCSETEEEDSDCENSILETIMSPQPVTTAVTCADTQRTTIPAPVTVKTLATAVTAGLPPKSPAATNTADSALMSAGRNSQIKGKYNSPAASVTGSVDVGVVTPQRTRRLRQFLVNSSTVSSSLEQSESQSHTDSLIRSALLSSPEPASSLYSSPGASSVQSTSVSLASISPVIQQQQLQQQPDPALASKQDWLQQWLSQQQRQVSERVPMSTGGKSTNSVSTSSTSASLSASVVAARSALRVAASNADSPQLYKYSQQQQQVQVQVHAQSRSQGAVMGACTSFSYTPYSITRSLAHCGEGDGKNYCREEDSSEDEDIAMSLLQLCQPTTTTVRNLSVSLASPAHPASTTASTISTTLAATRAGSSTVSACVSDGSGSNSSSFGGGFPTPNTAADLMMNLAQTHAHAASVSQTPLTLTRTPLSGSHKSPKSNSKRSSMLAYRSPDQQNQGNITAMTEHSMMSVSVCDTETEESSLQLHLQQAVGHNIRGNQQLSQSQAQAQMNVTMATTNSSMMSGYMAGRSGVQTQSSTTNSSPAAGAYSEHSVQLHSKITAVKQMMSKLAGNAISEALSAGVYFRDSVVDFGSDVEVGAVSRRKIELCNGNNKEVKVTVKDPSLPFMILHTSFTLKPKSFVRMPVRFIPTCAKSYSCLLAVTVTTTGSDNDRGSGNSSRENSASVTVELRGEGIY